MAIDGESSSTPGLTLFAKVGVDTLFTLLMVGGVDARKARILFGTACAFRPDDHSSPVAPADPMVTTRTAHERAFGEASRIPHMECKNERSRALPHAAPSSHVFTRSLATRTAAGTCGIGDASAGSIPRSTCTHGPVLVAHLADANGTVDTTIGTGVEHFARAIGCATGRCHFGRGLEYDPNVPVRVGVRADVRESAG